MARINLSIDSDLFELLNDDAKRHNCTVNVHIISLLEKIYKQNPFDYETALSKLCKEALSKPIGEEFVLFDLPSFSEICVAKAENANLKPSIARARLGKMISSLVREGKLSNDVDGYRVIRKYEEDGTPKFISRAAVYVKIDTKKEEKND